MRRNTRTSQKVKGRQSLHEREGIQEKVGKCRPQAKEFPHKCHGNSQRSRKGKAKNHSSVRLSWTKIEGSAARRAGHYPPKPGAPAGPGQVAGRDHGTACVSGLLCEDNVGIRPQRRGEKPDEENQNCNTILCFEMWKHKVTVVSILRNSSRPSLQKRNRCNKWVLPI